MKGCSKVGRPHPDLQRELKKLGLGHLQRNASVPAMSLSSLLAAHRVRSIGYLKVDVEGVEPQVFTSLERACERSPALWPRTINYEEKWMSRDSVVAVASMLKRHGYADMARTHVQVAPGLRGRCDPDKNRLWVRLLTTPG